MAGCAAPCTPAFYPAIDKRKGLGSTRLRASRQQCRRKRGGWNGIVVRGIDRTHRMARRSFRGFVLTPPSVQQPVRYADVPRVLQRLPGAIIPFRPPPTNSHLSPSIAQPVLQLISGNKRRSLEMLHGGRKRARHELYAGHGQHQQTVHPLPAKPSKSIGGARSSTETQRERADTETETEAQKLDRWNAMLPLRKTPRSEGAIGDSMTLSRTSKHETIVIDGDDEVATGAALASNGVPTPPKGQGDDATSNNIDEWTWLNLLDPGIFD
ncbi:hypothetical protein LTR10_002240 [Elasticomyces elasticus]|nr:hypothetical protein LTR10_002240 [Elasticomyces elasticus]KAK4973687.1 hypothetical protein LTR42_005676 [Elasticomyces elasticus]